MKEGQTSSSFIWALFLCPQLCSNIPLLEIGNLGPSSSGEVGQITAGPNARCLVHSSKIKKQAWLLPNASVGRESWGKETKGRHQSCAILPVTGSFTL